MKLTHDEFVAYVDGLQVGERVIETSLRCMQTGWEGTIYISDNPGPSFGSKCVQWDRQPGMSGQLGTAVTHGTRRLSDVPNFKGSLMHSYHHKQFTIAYNGDYSGYVELQNAMTSEKMEVSAELLFNFVAEAIRSRRISTLEQATPAQLLGVTDHPALTPLCDFYESRQQYVFWCPKGSQLEDVCTEQEGWHFWDEVGLHGGGPYPTEAEALAARTLYGKSLEDNQAVL